MSNPDTTASVSQSPSAPSPPLNPFKRRRVDEEDTAETSFEQATRHPTFWYHDGSIVLHVEETLFRVHQSFLSTHSEVFADMLAVPQPTGEEELEGCHIARLHGDQAADWEKLLTVLYDTLYLDTFQPVQSNTRKIMNFLPGVLRLATKYRFRAFRKKAIAGFTSLFPSDLPSENSSKWRPAFAIEMIRTAREINCLEVLPYAYLCVTDALKDHSDIYNLEQLPWMDKTVALSGMVGVAQKQAQHMFPFVKATWQFPTSCVAVNSTGGLCSLQHLKRVRDQPHKTWWFYPMQWSSMGLCPVCEAQVRKTYQDGRKEVWEMMPKMFCLAESWEDLRRIQDYDG